MTRAHSRSRSHARRGFTVLEILIAFTILLVGCVSVYALFGRGLISHKRAVDNTNASVLAGAVFDDISANYDAYYYDRNRNGTPDLGEDRNSNGVADWFELDAGGRPRQPVPFRAGYRYTIQYQRPADPELRQCLFVTVVIFWGEGTEQVRTETFYRTLYIKDLPDLPG